ncbi:hypothetical protein K7W42_20695, partial [Deinococcus sp. HMF7604]|uniref:hypothetical protein n=1 Tax=Deinococcus betulae TaxID=2873312 RepID=UPI001CCD0712
MMRASLAVAVLSTLTGAWAITVPPVTSPRLPATGSSVQALVPSGWVTEQRLSADFNGDRLDTL